MTPNIEKNVLLALLHSLEKIEKAISILKKEHFQTSHFRWTYGKLLDYYINYNEIPNVEYFQSELQQSKIDNTEKSRWSLLISELFDERITEGQQEYALDEILKFASKQEMLKIIEHGIDKLESGEIEDAIATLSATAKIKIYEKEYKIFNWIDEWDERQRKRKDNKENPDNGNWIKFPWKTLNMYIGGIQKPEVGTIASLTNVGKSISLMLCGKKAAIDGNKVTHITIEDSYDLIAQRYDSSILGVKYDDLKYFNLSKIELKKLNERVDLIRELIGDNIRIVKTIPRKTSIITIEKILKELDQSGFKTDYLIVDYADIMCATDKQEQFRLDQTVIYWDLKTLAESRSIPIMTATQVAKEYLRKKAYAEGLAEAYDKARILNLVLTLTQFDITSNDILMIIAKNRDGRKGMEIGLVSDYTNMQLREKE